MIEIDLIKPFCKYFLTKGMKSVICSYINNLFYFICRFCVNNQWKWSAHLNCTSDNCPLITAVYNYARDNFVLFNIFIKVNIQNTNKGIKVSSIIPLAICHIQASNFSYNIKLVNTQHLTLHLSTGFLCEKIHQKWEKHSDCISCWGWRTAGVVYGIFSHFSGRNFLSLLRK